MNYESYRINYDYSKMNYSQSDAPFFIVDFYFSSSWNKYNNFRITTSSLYTHNVKKLFDLKTYNNLIKIEIIFMLTSLSN